MASTESRRFWFLANEIFGMGLLRLSTKKFTNDCVY
jgi:hypothetical protein